ncbi:hypothetical protein Dxin01_00137 [Deinococcus xinjiangensis]|uniref:Uncharacterized protein n=1 Tax=Deinococcus xinjiangensis TaxID=457454 RepID=A0ABP9V584_9DEIO
MSHNDSTHHKITWHLSRENGQVITEDDIDELTDALLELIEARGMQVSGGVMPYDPKGSEVK